MPCGNDGVDPLVFKIKMCFPGSDIQDLEIKPPFGAVGREPGAREQMVSPAAAHDERLFFVHKIYEGVVEVC